MKWIIISFFVAKKKLYKQKKPPKYLNYMGSISLVIQSTDTVWVIPSVLYFAKMTWVHWHQDWVTIVCSPYFMFSNVRKKNTFGSKLWQCGSTNKNIIKIMYSNYSFIGFSCWYLGKLVVHTKKDHIQKMTDRKWSNQKMVFYKVHIFQFSTTFIIIIF